MGSLELINAIKYKFQRRKLTIVTHIKFITVREQIECNIEFINNKIYCPTNWSIIKYECRIVLGDFRLWDGQTHYNV